MFVTAKEVLSVEGFNPENTDIRDLTSLSKRIPSDGIVDEAVADQLSALFLHGADRCADLLAQATRWAAFKAAEKQNTKSEAILIRAEGAGYGKTQGSRESYAGMDNDYKIANSKDALATAWKKWLETKYEVFLKWHHLCKSIAERHAQGNNAQAPHQGAQAATDTNQAKTYEDQPEDGNNLPFD